MKNKVDIGKLIEKKYKGNTLQLSDILEQIDLVLQETSDNKYNSKIDTGDLEENPESVNISQRMYGVQGSRKQRPDELGYGDNVDNAPPVRPTTVAEGEDTKGSKKIEPVTVTVPDLFSLVSNQNMELDSPERLMINDIISNFKDGNWIDKAKELQKFIIDPLKIEGEGKDMGMRKAISSLMYISLLKKISFFIAQPGKLFEYIIAPLIGPDAKVVGSTDQDILDIDRSNGYGYSVKIFTGKFSSFGVKGSYENLQKAIAKDPNKAVTYIIAVSNKDKLTLQLVELNITSNQEYFKGYSAVYEYVGGTLYKDNTNPGIFGLYILDEEGKNKKINNLKLARAARVQKAAADKEAKRLQRAAEKETKKAQPKLEPQDVVNFDNQQLTVQRLKDIQKSLINNIRRVMDIDVLNTELNKSYAKNIFSDELKTALRDAVSSQQLKQFIDNYTKNIDNLLKSAEQKKIAAAAQAQQPVQQGQINELLYEVDGEDETQQSQTDPNIEDPNIEDPNAEDPNAEDPERQVPKYEFNLSLKGQWQRFEKIEFKFEDVKTYNKFALELSNGIQTSMANALNAFSRLGTNLTKYLGTARQGQDKNYAQRCIEDTVVIEQNILTIASEEGDEIIKKK